MEQLISVFRTTRDVLSRERFESVFSILVILLLLRLLLNGAFHAAVSPGGLRNVDFGQYKLAANRLNNGEPLYFYNKSDLYSGKPYVYPPPLAILFRPFARMSDERASTIWTAFSVAFLALGTFGVWYSFDVKAAPGSLAIVFMLITAFRYWPTVVELSLNNVDMLMFGIIASIYVCDRHGWFCSLGILIGAGALIKTWFLILVIYLAIRHAMRGFVAAFGVFTIGIAISFTLVGWKEFSKFAEIQLAFSHQPRLLSHSLFGFASLMLRANQHIEPLSVNGLWYHLLIAGGLVAAVFGLILTYWDLHHSDRANSRAALATVLLTVILVLPICHINYYVMLLPTFWTYTLNSSKGCALRRLAAVILAMAFYLLLSSPSQSVVPVATEFRRFPASLHVVSPFLAGVLLWMSGVCVLKRSPSRA